MPDVRDRVVLGTFFHAPEAGAIEVLEDVLIDVGADGAIRAVIRRDDPGYAPRKSEAGRVGALVALPSGSYGLPGFVDLHLHAPQYPQLGTALHVPLEVWLQQHTFPLEARYVDVGFAERAYAALVADILALGTTTAVLFATIHQEATRLLADICLDRGLRAVIGKVAMDNPESCPEYYRDASVAAGVDGTAAFIDYVRSHPENRDGRVVPAVTPRFIPSCTDPLLDELGKLAQACGCHVQTHCSESDWEHGEVLRRHGMSDAASLDGFGLLTRRTVLAHGNLLSGGDMERIAGQGAGVAHCPISNAYFSNAVFPLRHALQKGVRVGLGTDISGGPSASLLDNVRMAVASSRMLEDGVDPEKAPGDRGRRDSRIDWRMAFHLATAGGAGVLDLAVGSFAPGRQFDAIAVDTAAPLGTIRAFDEVDRLETLLQKIVYGATRANIADVWVGGRRVAGAADHPAVRQ